jgi:hypothetical protein
MAGQKSIRDIFEEINKISLELEEKIEALETKLDSASDEKAESSQGGGCLCSEIKPGSVVLNPIPPGHTFYLKMTSEEFEGVLVEDACDCAPGCCDCIESDCCEEARAYINRAFKDPRGVGNA